ncbi:cell surface glycoprotein CD200 receptor 1-A-like isoform X1 [Corapipo altera]|uniref:cell surface glycoprotein CD200 receptor 1-A-like isoform X1 n=1 Tax=Corapipo altera TaxID=415028 RepID=UPI000FD677AB|nr:cell surface glycoprotein CD200 receptor 1-A-like isoform X1 [Corapipo altera]XP_027509451.1 cell surface glycoprotein CD200 receptor 1-A-like isoform X1 [Corapipo altera]XP_027509452.1 cell surface glycoprotein CD200 receptor 1-A-like isoform X1 [Corapipo altera]
MKAGTNMKISGKTVYMFVLLTIIVMRSGGNNEVSVTIGDSSVLACPLKPNINMLTWKIYPKVGGPCNLGYRADTNTTDRTNCSDSMNWKFRPDLGPVLEIQQVGIAQEGNYICEVVTPEGNFHRTYHLTVLVPPRLSLFCDEHGKPVCEAAAGKPPAQVSWLLENNSSLEEESHDDGTVTVLSRLTACDTNVTDTTCVVFHPAGSWSESIACCPSDKKNSILYVSITLCLLSIMTFMAVIYYIKLHSNRLCHKTTPPETDPIQNDTMEVEPYTTYVQKENVIYNSVSDLTVGQNLPQELCPET